MQTIYLDISNRGVIPVIYAKQNDVGRKVEVVLTNSGLPYEPEAGSAFSAWYSGASGMGNYTDIGGKSAFAVSGNKVTVELITQMLQNGGEGFLCLVLSRANGEQIGLWNIRYICEGIPGAGSEPAKDYYTAFSQAVAGLPYPDVSLSAPGKAADAAAVGTALADKVSADVAVRKSGDTMTGNLNAPSFNVIGDSWNTFTFKSAAEGNPVRGTIMISNKNRIHFNQQQTGAKYAERYQLPTMESGLTADAWYNLVSTKHAKVLWNNGSPTSTFAAQTITINGLADCTTIAVIMNQTSGDSFVTIICRTVGATHTTSPMATRSDSANANAIFVVRRSVTTSFSNNTISFGNAYQNNTENNARAIPIAVIGLY